MATTDSDTVLLLVGPNQVNLNANFHLLSQASDVFAKMFKPTCWLEGQTKKATLEDDDEEGMKTIMDIIHFGTQQSKDYRPPKPETIREIAILADKYDFKGIWPFFEMWYSIRQKCPEYDSFEACAYWLKAAIIFKNDKIFSQLCKEIIMEYCDS